jgi:hypothetical protein
MNRILQQHDTMKYFGTRRSAALSLVLSSLLDDAFGRGSAGAEKPQGVAQVLGGTEVGREANQKAWRKPRCRERERRRLSARRQFRHALSGQVAPPPHPARNRCPREELLSRSSAAPGFLFSGPRISAAGFAREVRA